MRKIIFTCETITPLILGEAKREMVELRPPAIKSAMRFWWRAMHAHLTLIEMKRGEAEIFGRGGKDARDAKFDVVTSDPSREPVEYNYTLEKPRLIEDIKMGTTSGIQYLMYTFFYLKKKGKYFHPTTQFDVTFYFDNDNTHFSQILASFWLLVFFGNIGERSRRGVGSFKVTGITDNNSLLGDFNFTTYNLDAIRIGLNLIKNSAGFISPSKPTINNTYSHIFNNEIYFSNSWYPTWADALNDIGSKMAKFRLNNPDGTIADSTSHHLKAENSAIFGLPIKHSNGNSVKPKDFDRRASPLIIKIIQVGTNEFRWVLIRFGGIFLPIGNKKLNIRGPVDSEGKVTFPFEANPIILASFLNPANLNMTRI